MNKAAEVNEGMEVSKGNGKKMEKQEDWNEQRRWQVTKEMYVVIKQQRWTQKVEMGRGNRNS